MRSAGLQEEVPEEALLLLQLDFVTRTYPRAHCCHASERS